MVNRPVTSMRKWRLQERLSHAAAGALIGVTRQTWHAWETGRRLPAAAYMIELFRISDGMISPNSFYDLPSDAREAA